MRTLFALTALLVGALLQAPAADAQLADAKVLTLEAAKRMMDAAEAEAARNGWNVAIAIVDAGGELVMLHRRDGTQLASIEIARGKARTAVYFKRPTKALEDAVAGGRTVLVALDDITPLEGGIPIEVDGQIIGAIGVSGVMSTQDAVVAQAGLSALRP
jgi:glc operon protein GlcG